jgi:hypothetical protein
MVKVGKTSFNPKGCLDMTKEEFKAPLKSINSKLVNDAWNELQKQVKPLKPVAPKPKAKRVKKENEVKD